MIARRGAFAGAAALVMRSLARCRETLDPAGVPRVGPQADPGSLGPISSMPGITRSQGCMACGFVAALDDLVWAVPIWDAWTYRYVSSLQALVDEMNSRGLLTACGGTWHPSTVRNPPQRDGRGWPGPNL